MSPTLALNLCLLFCFVVLYQEGKLWQEAAWSVWLPTLWMMRCASRSLSVWFYPELADTELAEGSFHDQVFFGVLMLLGWVVLWQRRSRVQDILRRNICLCLFFGYMGVSVLWSEDMASFKRWFKAIGDLSMALLVTTEPKPLQAMLAVFRRTAYLLVPLSVLLVRYFHTLGTKPARNWAPDMWVGVSTHKNTLAQLCLFAGIVLFLDVIRTWRNNSQVLRLPLLKVRVDILCGAMLVYLLNGGGGHSRSTTAVLVIVFACSLILLLERQHRRGRQIMPARFIVGLLLSALVVHLGMELTLDDSLYAVVAESQGKDATLTGRTELWDDLLIMGQRHPLFGAGYGGFWTHANAEDLKQRHFWGPHQAHNGYIEVWLQLGCVGLLLFALAVGQALRGLAPLFQQDFEQGRFRLVVLIITLLHNYSEAGFPRPTHLVWFVFLIVVINLQPVQARAAEKAPAPADAAGQLWRYKQGSVRPRWSPSTPRTMHSRSLKLTPRLQGGQKP